MVPVKGPVAQIILFSGESGSTFGSTSSTKYLEAKPRDPKYSLAHPILRGSDWQVPLLKLTRRSFPAHDMIFFLCFLVSVVLIAEFVGPFTHSV